LTYDPDLALLICGFQHANSKKVFFSYYLYISLQEVTKQYLEIKTVPRNQGFSYFKAFGNVIRDVHPGSGIRIYFHTGSALIPDQGSKKHRILDPGNWQILF
jgi:hypothetical protein